MRQISEELELRDPVARSLSITVLAVAFFLLLVAVRPAAANAILGDVVLDEPIIGGSLLVATNGPVTATFVDSRAGYFNTLFLDQGTLGPDGLDVRLFDKSMRSGNPDERLVTLDGEFLAGDELVFRLDVRKQRNDSLLYSYYTGDGSRNPDGLPHAEAITTFDELTQQFITTVGFEDLYGGGDNDFDDFLFTLTNVVDPPQVPEPPILLLLSLGVGGIVYLRNRRFTKT
jgi:hypothetical protein